MLTDASLSSSFSDIRAENARLRQLLQQRAQQWAAENLQREQQWAAENLQREQQWAAERQQLVTEVNRLKRKKEEREITLLSHPPNALVAVSLQHPRPLPQPRVLSQSAPVLQSQPASQPHPQSTHEEDEVAKLLSDLKKRGLSNVELQPLPQPTSAPVSTPAASSPTASTATSAASSPTASTSTSTVTATSTATATSAASSPTASTSTSTVTATSPRATLPPQPQQSQPTTATSTLEERIAFVKAFSLQLWRNGSPL